MKYINWKTCMFISVALPILGLSFLQFYIPQNGIIWNMVHGNVKIVLSEPTNRFQCGQNILQSLVVIDGVKRPPPDTSMCGTEFKFRYRSLLVFSFMLLGFALHLKGKETNKLTEKPKAKSKKQNSTAKTDTHIYLGGEKSYRL